MPTDAATAAKDIGAATGIVIAIVVSIPLWLAILALLRVVHFW
jgi:diacylglycerol kinase